MAKWLNCADLDFGNPMPRLAMRTVHRYIRSLNVQVEEVMGIAAVFETRNQIVRLTFNSQATCSTFLDKHGGVKTVTLEDREINVSIKDSNEEEKYVRIAGLPHEMDLRIIQRRLKDFGKVFDLRWERYHVVEDEFLYPVLSSWLICRMVIEKDIPSYLTIGSYRTIVKYHGQKQTCRICDELNHMGRDCPTLRKNRMVVPVKTPSNPPTGEKESAANPQALIVEAVESVISENEVAATSAETINIANNDIVEPMEILTTQVIPETPIEKQPQGGTENIDNSVVNFPPISISDVPSTVEVNESLIPEQCEDSYLQRVKNAAKPNTAQNPRSTNLAKQKESKTSKASFSSAEPPHKKKSK